MALVKWSEIDELYEWVAMDMDGALCAYEKEPILGMIRWMAQENSEFEYLWEFDRDLGIDIDWDESLERRPKKDVWERKPINIKEYF